VCGSGGKQGLRGVGAAKWPNGRGRPLRGEATGTEGHKNEMSQRTEGGRKKSRAPPLQGGELSVLLF
jgi:hypothetical protein